MRRCLLLAIAGLALAPVAANAATVRSSAPSGTVTIIDDVGVAADISVVRDGARDLVSSPGGGLVGSDGCIDTSAGTEVSCPIASSYTVDLGDDNDRFRGDAMTVPISVAGGLGNDDIRTGVGADVLAGGDGNDTLDGRGGTDDYFGEVGDDTIIGLDGLAERISCGQGDDIANNDPIDIIAECERGVDGDLDGFSTAVDCNDAAATIFPGAPEIFDSGVDENCDGRDNPNLDRDGDGVPIPLDCNDGNAKIRPTVPEIRGNKVDENCDRRALAWAQLGATVSNQWVFSPKWTRLQRLVVISAPAGARITMRCSGRSCPTRKTRRFRVRNVLKRVVLHKGFRKARLRPGARIRVTIIDAQTIGRTYTYTAARGDPPKTTITCRAPGARRSRSC